MMMAFLLAWAVLMVCIFDHVVAFNNITLDGDISGIACDPTGTYLAASMQSGAGSILYSRNSGVDWIETNAPATGYDSFGKSSSDPNVLAAAASDNSIWISRDYGYTWTATISSPPVPLVYPISAIAMANMDQSIVLINGGAKLGGSCVFISTDGGASWNTNLLGPDAPDATCYSIATNANASQIVLSLSAPYGLYLSQDLGKSWSQVFPLPPKSDTTMYGVYSMVYNNQRSIFYASISNTDSSNPIIHSNPTGELWAPIIVQSSSLVSCPPMAIAVSYDGQYILVNDGGEIFLSSDYGSHYEEIGFPKVGGGYACIATMDVSPPPLYMFATHKSIYTTSVIPSASPTAQPTPLDMSCDDSICPTSCPFGATTFHYTTSMCMVYCREQPSYGQCSPGGKGCSSSCRTSHELALIIALALFAFIFYIALVYFILYRCGCVPRSHLQGQLYSPLLTSQEIEMGVPAQSVD